MERVLVIAMKHSIHRQRVLAALAVGASLTLAACGAASEQEPTQPAAKPAAKPTHPGLHLSALETARPMTHEVREKFWGPGELRGPTETRGFDLDDAVLVIGEQGGPQVHAATRTYEEPDRAGQTRICAVTTFPPPADRSTPASATSPCAPFETFNQNGLVSTVGNVPDITIVGLLPDGVKSATLTFADGSTTQVPVNNNGLVVHANRKTSTLTFDGPQGTGRQIVEPFEG
jgi:hypothetical protein